MIKQIILIFYMLLLLISCDNKKIINYQYVITVEVEDILGAKYEKEKESQTIEATSDSTAYLDAYQKFCVSVKVSNDMLNSIGKSYSIPKRFKLYNEHGVDISNKYFENKHIIEKEIQERVNLLENSFENINDNDHNDSQE